MPIRKHLIAILLVSCFGLALSGYLSYWNLWGPGCHEGPLSGIISCGGPQKVLIFGLPTCVYGFFMYLAVAVTAGIGLSSANQQRVMPTLIGLGVAGTLFAGGLTIYELAILKLTFSALPACVYGLVLYGAVLVISVLARRRRSTPNVPPVAAAA